MDLRSPDDGGCKHESEKGNKLTLKKNNQYLYTVSGHLSRIPSMLRTLLNSLVFSNFNLARSRVNVDSPSWSINYGRLKNKLVHH